MSCSKCLCAGTILRVHLKNVDSMVTLHGCAKCKTESNTKFCAFCGDPHADYSAKHKGPFDTFEMLDEHNLSDKYITLNSEDRNDNAYIVFNEEDEFHKIGDEEGFQKMPLKAPDDYYKEITDMLDEKGVKYEILYGIYVYWW